MIDSDQHSMKSLTAKVAQYAKSQIKNVARLNLFTTYSKLFYSHASADDLKHRSTEELFSMALSNWNLLYVRKNTSNWCIRVFNPDLKRDGWNSTHTVVELIANDIPFIVDSMRMEMNRLGLTTHFMIYMGGMQVYRNAAGLVTEITSYSSVQKSGCVIEAPVYMEIDYQPDAIALEQIKENLERVLSDVQVVSQDWMLMRSRIEETIRDVAQDNKLLSSEEMSESIAFLKWLLDDQFTFLGMRDYKVVGQGDQMALQLIKHSGLGVLRDETHSKSTRLFTDLPESARELMLSTKQVLVISKTNTLSTVHRSVYTDYIGIKQFDNKGALIGERRIIGLYTSTAYSSHPDRIPFLRHKVANILKKSGLPPKSHAVKDLMHILETFPRDDLFQGGIDELYSTAIHILNLQDRRKIRLFVRKDVYRRYVSCLVFVPRDNFSSQLILRIQNLLMNTFHGLESNYTTYFYTPVLTRIHYIIRLDSKKRLHYKLQELEEKLIEIGKSWQDNFRETALLYFGALRGNQMIERYLNAFSVAYREDFSPKNAIADIEQIEKMSADHLLGMDLYRTANLSKQEVKFKLYRFEKTVPLSDTLPILENMGLRVVGEQAYQLTFNDSRHLWINDLSMTISHDWMCDIEILKPLFQEAFNKIWLGQAENDLFNVLVLEMQLNWKEVSVLRAYTKYLRQTGFTYSTHYVAETFIKYPEIAKLFIRLFDLLFNPAMKQNATEIKALETEIAQKIDAVALLDEDRILNHIFSVIKATLRTNFYQSNKYNLSFKLSPEKIPELPLPLPKYEIFVYSPAFEGVHLRMAKVARGGLRWSDRKEDFRTEVLGLMKAQQVKNAVIVPAGAKGGFFPKNLPKNGTRDEIQAEAIACYKGFIQGLLDLTDNTLDNKIISPKDAVCYDDADPYLVVAADKGTASFSDIANQIAIDNNFWLGDAFASGGSSGYDHKKMAITARGAWVSAERHFQRLGINVDEAEITVVGIGDLSGDVFGNGVLLSEHLKLVAAFNHQHIFLDPNPNPKKSFQERKRLFDLPRSTWADYSADCISSGGGVFSRSLKAITLSPEVKTLLDITADRLTPSELIQAILRAPVDLIWNGGIGTFVKASTETHEQVGDRINDVLRINAEALRAKAVVEGGNLGFTQLARIEYAQKGGLINTDFIDNSGGVDCSDHEVNIKILLNSVVQAGELTEKQRNQLLVVMTDEVANLVLQNNYHQNLVVSLLSHFSYLQMNLYLIYMKVQEKMGKLNRELEYLPDNKTMFERRSNNLGLTQPEISVLLSYSKIILKSEILNSNLINDAYFYSYLNHSFPKLLQKKYPNYILKHRLRNEILATQLSNYIVSKMGITFVYQMSDEMNVDVATIVRAFVLASEIFHVEEIYTAIELLDFKVDMTVQLQMLDELIRLIRGATRWFLRNPCDLQDIQKTTQHFEPYVKSLYKKLPKLLLGNDKTRLEKHVVDLTLAGVPSEMAMDIALGPFVYHALNIIEAATSENIDVYQAAKIYFILGDRLDLYAFRYRINAYPVSHHWTVLAKAAFKSDLDKIQQKLTGIVIKEGVDIKNSAEQVDTWLKKNAILMNRWQLVLNDLRNEEITDFSIISVAIRELFDLIKQGS